MTLNDIIDALAAKLGQRWPDRPVYANAIPSGGDGAFLLRLRRSAEEGGLGQQRVRTLGLEVLYYLASDDQLSFYHWAEAMHELMETVTLPGGHKLRLGARVAEHDGSQRAYRYSFQVVSHVLATPAGSPGALMEQLLQRPMTTQQWLEL